MKKLLLAGVLALTLVAVSQERASAWFRFKVGGSFHFSWESSCPCFYFGFCPGPPPPDCHGGYGGDFNHWAYLYLPPYVQMSSPQGASAPSYTAPPPRPLEQQGGYGSGSWSPYYGPYYANWYR